MQLTGERTLPGIPHENYWFRRHEVVYHWAAGQLVDPADEGRGVLRSAWPAGRILDAGCGEGYGADWLRRTTGAGVSALDYDHDAAAHVRETYAGLPVVRGNLVQLPYADNSFDAVVSLQTVEHLWDQQAFVAECARVTRPGGRIVLSTPNRLTFPPGNICHAKELTGPELAALLTTPPLDAPYLVGLRHGGRIRDWEANDGPVVTAQLAAAPEEWPERLAGFVASLRAEDFEIEPGGLDSSQDLLAVSRVRAE